MLRGLCKRTAAKYSTLQQPVARAQHVMQLGVCTGCPLPSPVQASTATGAKLLPQVGAGLGSSALRLHKLKQCCLHHVLLLFVLLAPKAAVCSVGLAEQFFDT